MAKKVLILILLFIGIIFRVYKVDSIPPGFFADEIALAINAKTIAEDGVDEFGNRFPFGFESFSDYKLPGYIYLTALIYKFLGSSILTIRLIALFSSILSIPLIGYLAYLLFPKKRYFPYITMAILAISPYHIHFGRIAYETMLATTFFLLFLISFVHVIKKNKRRLWLFLGTIFLFLSSWTYHAPKFIIPVFLFLLFFWGAIVKSFKINRKNTIRASLFFLLVTFVSYIPFIINPEIDKRPFGYLSTFRKSDLLTIASSWFRIWDFEFLFLKGDPFGFRHSNQETGLFLGVMIFPLMAGIGYFLKKLDLKNFSHVFIILLLITAGLPSSLTHFAPYGPRLLPMIIPITILLALGTERLIVLIVRQKDRVRYLFSFLFLVVLFYQIGYYAHIYFVHFPKKSLSEFPSASIEVVKFIKEEYNENSQKVIYFLNGKNCLAWGHDELKLWYFVDLENREMIKWNNLYREIRYNTDSPFFSFSLDRPRFVYKNNLILNASHSEMSQASSSSLLVRCGIHGPDINKDSEKIVKRFYMYPREKRDIIYVVSEKL